MRGSAGPILKSVYRIEWFEKYNLSDIGLIFELSYNELFPIRFLSQKSSANCNPRIAIRVRIAQLGLLHSKQDWYHYTTIHLPFAVMGPRLWNILPSNLHLIKEPQQFKIKLTEFVNLFPDRPPVSGNSCANSNSLLDWSKNNMAAVQQGRSGTTMTQ